jgi:hypothetical protein
MIGYQWTVYHQWSGHNADGILAAGVSSRADQAKTAVETILATQDSAACGLLVRICLDGLPGGDAVPEADWPPPGEMQLCRRTRDGGCLWAPMYPREWVSG